MVKTHLLIQSFVQIKKGKMQNTQVRNKKLVDDMADVIYTTLEQLKDQEVVITHYEDAIELVTDNAHTRAIVISMLNHCWADEDLGYEIELIDQKQWEGLNIMRQAFYPTSNKLA